MSVADLERVGAVAIGRNEGERLRQCLCSLVGKLDAIVYVDSGSVDGSVDLARGLGVEVVELDLSIPFTAARARNAGFARLLECRPDLELVQFVDGDCEVVSGWLEHAATELRARQDVAVVCGRRRERYPDASIYNRLCDLEWDTPIGEAKYCGGDILMRVAALRQVDGYNPTLIAGEEPELCVRLRSAGWRILRIDAEMTLHDADMHRFGQWWKRAVRAGHAYAEGAWLHGRSHDRHYLRPVLSICFWSVALPLAALGCSWKTNGLSLVLLAAYPLQWWRISSKERRAGRSWRDGRAQATFILFAKFAELCGMLEYLRRRLLRSRPVIIEYKRAEARPSIRSPS